MVEEKFQIPPLTEDEIRCRLVRIKNKGFVVTHRHGPTGVGKTLEDLSGIPENNLPGPDHRCYELKSGRKNSQSMLTLFTKSPLPPKANSELLKRFGYLSVKGNGRKELHTTVLSSEFNTLKGQLGFKIVIERDRLVLVSALGDELGFWDKETLRERFETKYPGLLYVKAESRGRGIREEFWFDEAWFLWDFSFDNFVRLVREDVIKTDIRIGQYPDGRPHDHGTGFRVMPNKLELCFEHRQRII